MQEILNGILKAIEDEISAQKHYQALADKAEDPMAKNFFLQLKLDEEQHEQVLRTRYEAFLKLFQAQSGEQGKEVFPG